MSSQGHSGRQGLDIWTYVARLGVQMRGAGDNFFAEGDAICSMRTCQYLTQIDTEELLHKDYQKFPCSVPGCDAKFSQLIDHEAHYNAKHRHSCCECRKSLPSAHLLGLHLAETHDSYFQLLSAKKPSYECFLEACKDKFWNAQERREHCIGIHSFPHDFKFENQKKGENRVGGGNRKQKADSTSPEVKKRSYKKNAKPRPASVFVPTTAAMEIDDNERLTVETVIKSSPVKSKLPVSFHRRLSLNTTASPRIHGQDEMLASIAPTSREPLSLAKMGQRISAKSTIDITRDALDSSTALINSQCGAKSVISAIITSDPSPLSTGKLTSPKKSSLSSGIPTRTVVRKTNSTSSTATSASISSPERSLASSPTKSRSAISVHNNNSQIVHDDVNGNSSGSSSPNKSRIPVLRSSSCKVPKNFSFGHTKRSFEMKHWYQVASKSEEKTDSSLDSAQFEQDLKMALD